MRVAGAGGEVLELTERGAPGAGSERGHDLGQRGDGLVAEQGEDVSAENSGGLLATVIDSVMMALGATPKTRTTYGSTGDSGGGRIWFQRYYRRLQGVILAQVLRSRSTAASEACVCRSTTFRCSQSPTFSARSPTAGPDSSRRPRPSPGTRARRPSSPGRRATSSRATGPMTACRSRARSVVAVSCRRRAMLSPGASRRASLSRGFCLAPPERRSRTSTEPPRCTRSRACPAGATRRCVQRSSSKSVSPDRMRWSPTSGWRRDLGGARTYARCR